MPQKRTVGKKRKTSTKAPAKRRNVAKASVAKTGPAKNAIAVRPLADDEIELSGVFGRVRFREDDPYAEVREIFDHYDRDKNGLIAAKEFARLLEALGMEIEEHELKIALLDVDHDGDQQIAWDDFLNWWKAMRG
jgi:hypothetical protein